MLRPRLRSLLLPQSLAYQNSLLHIALPADLSRKPNTEDNTIIFSDSPVAPSRIVGFQPNRFDEIDHEVVSRLGLSSPNHHADCSLFEFEAASKPVFIDRSRKPRSFDCIDMAIQRMSEKVSKINDGGKVKAKGVWIDRDKVAFEWDFDVNKPKLPYQIKALLFLFHAQQIELTVLFFSLPREKHLQYEIDQHIVDSLWVETQQ
ncbi:MAG: hypothetical protein N2515_08810 [Deltaproteobacteria bacterium]|nr:hypothetical protein [Deltaproteobacteria bacterium]